MIVISSRRFVESSNHHSQQPLYKEQISNLPTFRSWLTGCAACGEQSIICGRNLWGAQENTLYLVKILIHCFCEVSRLLFVCPALWPNRADVCRAPAHPAPWPAGMGEDGGYNTVNFSWRKLSLSNFIFLVWGQLMITEPLFLLDSVSMLLLQYWQRSIKAAEVEAERRTPSHWSCLSSSGWHSSFGWS